MSYPRIAMQPKRHLRVKAGHPWAYSNEIDMNPVVRKLPPGTLVDLATAGGEPLGTAMFNPHSLVAARLLAPVWGVQLDAAFIAARLQRALDLRARLFARPFYRLIHAEADGLPGTIVDRFDDVVVVQLNTAGLAVREAEMIAALESVLAPRAIVMRNDSASRTLEGLPEESGLVRGSLDGPLSVEENGVVYRCDPVGGQKTGWFYDQRDNRAFVAALSKGKRVIDIYTYLGGFGLAAAKAGAASVTLVDRSQPALDIARQAADANGLGDRVETVRASAFEEMERRVAAGEKFEVVIADPPAFVKSRKDLAAGARGYRKTARMAAALTAPGGIMLIASCSHNMSPEMFAEQVAGGLTDARRNGRLLRQAGAAPDHPVHPFLPESAYLKAMVLQLD